MSKFLSRLFILLILINAVSGLSFSETAIKGTWNILISRFVNRTEDGRDESLGLVIQRSLVTFLGQVEYFRVTESGNGIISLEKEIAEGFRNGEDILITGSYAVVGNKIYISVSVHDIIQKQLKFESSYSGSAGLEIFETIDRIIMKLKQDLLKVVKPMEEETYITSKKRVNIIREEIRLDRSLVNTAGWSSALNNRPYTGLPFIEFDARLDWLNGGGEIFIPILFTALESEGYWRNDLLDLYAGYCFKNMTAGLGYLLMIRYAGTYGANGTGPLVYFRYDLGNELDVKAYFAVTSVTSDNGDLIESFPTGEPLGFVFGIEGDYYFLNNFGVKLEYYYGFYIDSSNGHSAQNNLILVGVDYRLDFK